MHFNIQGVWSPRISRRLRLLALAMIFPLGVTTGLAQRGAAIPWTTYEAENMATSGSLLTPGNSQNNVQSESSGRACVKLSAPGQYAQFTAQAAANALVVRYSVPDTANGGGTNYTLSLYINGVFAQELPVTSQYSWLYGGYPFVNTPASGSPRNFYDEVRVSGLSINPGDVVRLQKDAGDTAAYYVIDLVDLENAAPALTAPANSLSITNYGADATGAADATAALLNCIGAAASHGESVWLPAGTYKISATINLPSNVTIQGAGMWHTTLVGDPAVYATTSRRITFNGAGSNIHLADFAIIGKLNYRNDSEPNDGLGGAYGVGSTISRIWVEHTKTGAWIINSTGLVITGCRFRDTIADGCNIDVGMRGTIVTNCTARGTGDDCFAIWPAGYTSQTYVPGLNVFTQCTGELSWLANGGAIYGGTNNAIQNCVFRDMTYDCGILISSTFAVGSGDGFSGTTVAQDCDVIRCGGAAGLQICLALSGISGLYLDNLNITNSISSGMSIINTGSDVSLSNAVMANVSIPNYNLGGGGKGLWAESGTAGSLTVSNSLVADPVNSSAGFSFKFATNFVTSMVSTSPTGLAFNVDGTNYTSAEVFKWISGFSHTVAVAGTQSGTVGTQFAWNAWSDGGALTHAISPSTNTTLTANFATQYYLTMNTGPGGSASPAGGWANSGAIVNINAVAGSGYVFADWTGSGNGAYSGSDNPVLITMNGPVTEDAAFATDLAQFRPPSLNINTQDGGVRISFSGVPGYQYTVQRSTNLVFDSGWAGISTNTTLTNIIFTVIDTFPDIGRPQGTAFYRLSVQ